jgi:SAM-dependent methyltransferase
MTAGLDRASFHDPDGSVFLGGGTVLRALAPEAAQRLDAFLGTDVHAQLLGRGELPRTERVAPPSGPGLSAQDLPGDARWFGHERLPFINYPHEWIPDQLVDACRLTLDLSRSLREAGWNLKDGNARNVVFRGRQPVFVDFGSFEHRDDSSPVWRPAGQVQRHFLLPLLAFLKLGWNPANVLLSHPDGLSHDEAYRSLRSWRWSDRHVFWLCTVPAMLGRLGGSRRSAVRPLAADVCRTAADLTVRSLRRRLDALASRLGSPQSHWAAYEGARTHYTGEQLALKRAAVDRMLRAASPRSLLDIGTNGGEYSNLAASQGCEVVSIDSDVGALRVARQAAAEAKLDVLHLLVDFTAPTPALGWNGVECQSFDQRCEKRFDLVMGLAVLHHVLVAGRIPLDEVLSKLASYTRRHMIIEYVDPSDEMFDAIAQQRATRFDGLTRDSFESALQRRFRIDEAVELIPGRRTLYLCSLH